MLLDASGNPVSSTKTEIPFIRAFPDGTRGLQTIDRGPETYALACLFIAMNGRYGIAVQSDGRVDLTALIEQDGELLVLDEMTAPNDAEMLGVIDRLVRSSVDKLGDVQ